MSAFFYVGLAYLVLWAISGPQNVDNVKVHIFLCLKNRETCKTDKWHLVKNARIYGRTTHRATHSPRAAPTKENQPMVCRATEHQSAHGEQNFSEKRD